MKLILIIFFTICFARQASAQHYFIGDTMNVVALKGLKLRETPNLGSSIITLLNNGEKIVIEQLDQSNEDNIDGFHGRWVKIHPLNSTSDGFVFDAFISRYPVLTKFEYIKDFVSGKYNWKDDDMYDFLPAMLEEYALNVFRSEGCQVFYSNGSDGESSFSMSITQMNDKVTLIKHGYSEGHGIELDLSNPRISEIYYWIMNILKFVPAEITTLDEEGMKTEKEFGQECIKIGEHGCIMRILFKGDNLISILFNNACC